MGAMASQISSLACVYSIVHSGADQRRHQSSASLAFEFPAQMASNAENVFIDDVIMNKSDFNLFMQLPYTFQQFYIGILGVV